jgi:nitrite reductase/ring-hydroxylating ferredoxin subunit
LTSFAHGWYQLAFERDLTPPLTPLSFGGRALMAVWSPTSGPPRILDAVCPHRGAHLARGGRLAGEVIVCPFHAYRIGLGKESRDGFCVREYRSLLRGGGLFARLSDRDEVDFPEALEALAAGHTFVPGFEMTARTTIDVVIENGFDNAHFRSVHGLMSLPELAVRTGPFGELLAEGHFEIPRTGWYEPPGAESRNLRARYVAHAFSPGVFLAELEGDPPYRYRILTTASPAEAPRECTIRLTLLLPQDPGGAGDDERFVQELIEHSRAGLEQDRLIWDHLAPGHVPQLTAADQAAAAFAEFCRRFRTHA